MRKRDIPFVRSCYGSFEFGLDECSTREIGLGAR